MFNRNDVYKTYTQGNKLLKKGVQLIDIKTQQFDNHYFIFSS